MSAAKKSVDDLIDETLNTKKKKPKNWVDRLSGEPKEFLLKLRERADNGMVVSATVVSEKLRDHFNVEVSSTQVRRFLKGEVNVSEDQG